MNSGIYKITNLVNNKLYIGCTSNLSKRERDHFSHLKREKHVNPHLQHSYNKHGRDNFKFEILFTCPREDLLRLEQYCIDNYKPEYNILKISNFSPGVSRKKSRVVSVKGKIDNRDNRRKHKMSTLKLTVKDVLDIKLMLFQGIRQKHCAIKYNITISNVSAIKREITWSDIKLELNGRL